MASRFSLIPEVIDGLVTGLRAATGFRSPTGSGDGVTVYDGPEWIGGQSTEAQGFLVIGYGGEELETRGVGDDPQPMTQTTEIRSISTAARKEQDIEIPCVAYYGTGSTLDISAARTAVFAIVALVESWLTSNPRATVATQADGSQVLHATATGSHSFRQYVDPGARAVVEFTITAKTRT